MTFEYLKAFHIIFIVTWFAGLFYIVRLFIYQTEALQKPEAEKKILVPHLNLMTERLWLIITWPSAVLTLIFGFWVLYYRSAYLEMGFMQAKLVFVLLLYVYHFKCHQIYKQLQNGIAKWTSTQLRIWNEVATVLLFAVVFLIVLKSMMDMVWGLLSLVVLSVILMIGIKWYKNHRNKKGASNE
jgi:protoporphyrinogen IX oxidase